MSRKILLIVASGKSSRFGGFPKAFCTMNNMFNAENTCEKARGFYDKVYIGVNKVVFDQYNGKIRGCEMFSIVTGQGDAHSLLKCIKYVKEVEKNIEYVTVCWGDAVFVDSTPFAQIESCKIDCKVLVACSIDKEPYAWFDVNSYKEIIKAHFAKDEKCVEYGLHDQSIFRFECNFAISYLNEYREFLDIPEDNDENVSDVNEMKLLHSFEFLIKKGYEPARCYEILPNKVLSFNTAEELEIIKKKISR